MKKKNLINKSRLINNNKPNSLHGNQYYVADYEGRSANSQILVFIRDCIKNFEDKNGEIEFGNNPAAIAKSPRRK